MPAASAAGAPSGARQCLPRQRLAHPPPCSNACRVSGWRRQGAGAWAARKESGAGAVAERKKIAPRTPGPPPKRGRAADARKPAIRTIPTEKTAAVAPGTSRRRKRARRKIAIGAKNARGRQRERTGATAVLLEFLARINASGAPGGACRRSGGVFRARFRARAADRRPRRTAPTSEAAHVKKP